MTDKRELKWMSPRNATPNFRREAELPVLLRLLRRFGHQTWIPRGRDLVLRTLLDPATCQHSYFDVDFFGMRYQGDLAHYIDWVVYMYGSYAYPELSLLAHVVRRMREARPSISFFDIGANVGHHSLFMAPLVDDVFAFEPFAELRALIEHKISINKLTNVRVIPAALGDSDHEHDYFPGQGSNSGMGTLIEQHGGGFAGPVRVSVRAGDRLFNHHHFPRLDIVKVDVEGYEPFVFRGLSAHIRRDQPIILTEWSDASRQHVASEAEFHDLFYEGAIFAEVGGRPGCRFNLRPFSYETAHEVLILPPHWSHLL